MGTKVSRRCDGEYGVGASAVQEKEVVELSRRNKFDRENRSDSFRRGFLDVGKSDVSCCWEPNAFLVDLCSMPGAGFEQTFGWSASLFRDEKKDSLESVASSASGN